MAKKGQVFIQYTEQLKSEAIRLYESGVSSREVAKQLNIRSKCQVLDWVKKSQNGVSLEDGRGQNTFRKGRPKTRFASLEEELVYLKAENEYLKKQYPNLHKE
ncbi:transposase [Paenibacillus humicola]|uniref:transposase n=1 Tax=Paenibacillus humicola TaxID=3110540 RepID=UPI00237BAD00|nr:transposase [Paenibacillus humicola]